jgi:hypothetical protein
MESSCQVLAHSYFMEMNRERELAISSQAEQSRPESKVQPAPKHSFAAVFRAEGDAVNAPKRPLSEYY